jgi:hypothetical protein
MSTMLCFTLSENVDGRRLRSDLRHRDGPTSNVSRINPRTPPLSSETARGDYPYRRRPGPNDERLDNLLLLSCQSGGWWYRSWSPTHPAYLSLSRQLVNDKDVLYQP